MGRDDAAKNFKSNIGSMNVYPANICRSNALEMCISIYTPIHVWVCKANILSPYNTIIIFIRLTMLNFCL